MISGSNCQRSRKGCLTCRQKRKKCDETTPVCSRCIQGGSRCEWPLPQVGRGPKGSNTCHPLEVRPKPSGPSRAPPVHSHSSSFQGSSASYFLEHNPTQHALAHNTNLNLDNYGDLFAFDYPFDLDVAQLYSTVEPLLESNSRPTALQLSRGTPSETLGHLLTQLPETVSSVTSYANGHMVGFQHLGFDEDEEEAFKTEQWLPAARQSFCIGIALADKDQAKIRGILDSYIVFLARCTYDPTKLPAYIRSAYSYIGESQCVRLGVMSSANLYHAILNPSASSATLRNRAQELFSAASVAFKAEVQRDDISPAAKLAGINEIIGHHYISGNFSEYLKYIDQAKSLVEQLVHEMPLPFHKLQGPETINIRIFIWCDIFSSVALSRPTRLSYECNTDELLSQNQKGPTCRDDKLDTGMEWLAGLPDALLMLMLQIINLRHSHYTPNERIALAAKIEASLRNWQVWPDPIANSKIKVQRMSAQEIWRHFVILFLYQAIHRATSANPVVQQSVKQIVRLGSTLQLGHNPASLLCMAFFMAGTFAVSAQDRYFLRSLVLHGSTEDYTRRLADGLDEIWSSKKFNDTYDWTNKSSPITFMF